MLDRARQSITVLFREVIDTFLVDNGFGEARSYATEDQSLAGLFVFRRNR